MSVSLSYPILDLQIDSKTPQPKFPNYRTSSLQQHCVAPSPFIFPIFFPQSYFFENQKLHEFSNWKHSQEHTRLQGPDVVLLHFLRSTFEEAVPDSFPLPFTLQHTHSLPQLQHNTSARHGVSAAQPITLSFSIAYQTAMPKMAIVPLSFAKRIYEEDRDGNATFMRKFLDWDE